MADIRLLLVDDHADTLEVLSVLLAERYSVVSCRSAAEALTALEASGADVVTLDIGMAPVDGVACLKMMRALPGYAGIPAIALTGWVREVDRQQFLAAGFQAVVSKPVLEEGALIAAIDKVVRSPAGAP